MATFVPYLLLSSKLPGTTPVGHCVQLVHEKNWDYKKLLTNLIRTGVVFLELSKFSKHLFHGRL
jgi:hypothetical protein